MVEFDQMRFIFHYKMVIWTLINWLVDSYYVTSLLFCLKASYLLLYRALVFTNDQQ